MLTAVVNVGHRGELYGDDGWERWIKRWRGRKIGRCWMFYSLTHGHVTRYTLVDVISPPPPTPPPPQAVTAPIDSLQVNWMPVKDYWSELHSQPQVKRSSTEFPFIMSASRWFAASFILNTLSENWQASQSRDKNIKNVKKRPNKKTLIYYRLAGVRISLSTGQ